jgi:hypothetical protein
MGTWTKKKSVNLTSEKRARRKIANGRPTCCYSRSNTILLEKTDCRDSGRLEYSTDLFGANAIQCSLQQLYFPFANVTDSPGAEASIRFRPIAR